jgi:hypothetical protein
VSSPNPGRITVTERLRLLWLQAEEEVSFTYSGGLKILFLKQMSPFSGQ